MPEWLIEHGIGETRAILVDNDEIIESRIELDDTIRAGSVLEARLARGSKNSRNAIVKDKSGTEYLLPGGAGASPEGSLIRIEVTREAIPGKEPWKRPLARLTDKLPTVASALEQRIDGTSLTFPGANDRFSQLGWNELLEEARTGIVAFAGGELRVSVTPAMTLIDVDGILPADQLAVRGAKEGARAIRRLDIGGNIGMDLPTCRSKAARQAAAAAIDGALSPPFERTSVNGFGFVQIIRPRIRSSLVEIAGDRPSFEARALMRRIAFEPPGAKRIVAHPSVAAVIESQATWIDRLVLQLGGAIELRADADLPMSGGYAETF